MHDHIRHLQGRLATAERERDDLRLAKEGVEALLCDAQKEIAELKAALDGARLEVDELRATLRPFAEAYRAYKALIMMSGLADAAELAPGAR
jgi:hypothetical protein